MSLLVVYTMLTFCQSVSIWNDPLDSANGHPINWTMTLDTAGSSISSVSNPTDCPTLDCWQFHGASSAYYISPTINFINISITYSVSAPNLESNAADECSVHYSINATTTWNKVQGHNSGVSTNTIPLPSSTSNNIGVGIKIEAVSELRGAQDDDDCYFQDISLNGITVAPTTANPTTIQPTTSVPTTNTPSQYPTKVPTTAEPSHIPTSAAPTTDQPTRPPGAPTSDPTLDPVTVAPTESPVTVLPTEHPVTLLPTTPNIATTYNDNDNGDNKGLLGLGHLMDNDMVVYGVYGGAALVLLLCIAIVICCWCRRCNKAKGRSIEMEKVKSIEGSPALSGQGTTKDRFIEDAGFEHDRYDQRRITENAERTNELPEDFWKEESESYEKNRVVNQWAQTGSHVVESKRNVRKQKKAPMRQQQDPIKAKSQPPPTTMSQVFGRRTAKEEEEDSDDDSLMKKQREFQGNYDPDSPSYEEELEEQESEYEEENEELKAEEYATPGGPEMDLGESDDDEMLISDPKQHEVIPETDVLDLEDSYTETESDEDEQNKNNAMETKGKTPFVIQVHNEAGLLVAHEDGYDEDYGSLED